ncbi:MAG: hypothetical protein GTO55_03145, partial [Armatimonadetes bacterium]|nr:hypothetical protein [Armatimonadota bacterium]NIM23270.1 hypothetical protein [Armatimonadota bacterium]NIM67138.1 hypothetical protein [Armatimonadota bacterium]NIN05327.1 hypothetical protein [Armatimonadota bacterium]NIO96406.1 hypothetical protein [Armatimonadota bacterium]
MRWIAESMRKPNTICRGHTTQFIVGATPETDRSILQTVTGLYHNVDLERAYFSAFQPVAGT